MWCFSVSILLETRLCAELCLTQSVQSTRCFAPEGSLTRHPQRVAAEMVKVYVCERVSFQSVGFFVFPAVKVSALKQY